MGLFVLRSCQTNLAKNPHHPLWFFFSLHFNVLMQPKAMKHSILSTYIDTHRVVLTMYVVWKSSLRETGS